MSDLPPPSLGALGAPATDELPSRSRWPIAAVAVVALVGAIALVVTRGDGGDGPPEGRVLPIDEGVTRLMGRPMLPAAAEGWLVVQMYDTGARDVVATGVGECGGFETRLDLSGDGTVDRASFGSEVFPCDDPDPWIPVAGDRLTPTTLGLRIARGDGEQIVLRTADSYPAATAAGDLAGRLSLDGVTVVDLFAESDSVDEQLAGRATFGGCSLGWAIREAGRIELTPIDDGPNPAECQPIDDVAPALTGALVTRTARLWIVGADTVLATDVADPHQLYVLDRTPTAQTVDDLSAALGGRRWVLARSAPDDFESALRPTLSFDRGDDRWSVGSYDACTWSTGSATLAIDDGRPIVEDYEFESSTANECSDRPGPGPGLRPDTTYEVQVGGGTLVLRSTEHELTYVDLADVDRAHLATVDDLVDSWRFPGTDLTALIGSRDGGPALRWLDCTIGVSVPVDGALLLDGDPEGCSYDGPVDEIAGRAIEIFIDASGAERVPIAADALVSDDVMYVVGRAGAEFVYRLIRQGEAPPAAFGNIVGDPLVVAGPERGPAVSLRIEEAVDDQLLVDGIDECNGYRGTVVLDEGGVVLETEIEVDANECSGPAASGGIRPGDALRTTVDGLTITRDGEQYRLVSLDLIDPLTRPAEVDALGEIRIGGQRVRFLQGGVVEVDGCELSWSMDQDGLVTAVDGDADDPLCAGADPELVAYGLQSDGVSFHRSVDGLWIRAIGLDLSAPVIVTPPRAGPVDGERDLIGLPLGAVGDPLGTRFVPWMRILWWDDATVRLLLDVGCGPEEIDVVLDADRVIDVVRGALLDCDPSLLPRPGDQLIAGGDGIDLVQGDLTTRFTWVGSFSWTDGPAVPNGNYLVDGHQVAVDDTTFTVDDCSQPYRLRDDVLVFPVETAPDNCAAIWPPQLTQVLSGGVTIGTLGDREFLLERHGVVVLMEPDSGSGFDDELNGLWFIERATAPPELAVVAPSSRWAPAEDGYEVAIFDGCARATYRIDVDNDGVIGRADLVAGEVCDDDVPFEPVVFRVADRIALDGFTMRLLAPDGGFRYDFRNNPSIVRADWSRVAGSTGRLAWRPAGSDVEPITFSNLDGAPYVEWGRCATAATFADGQLQLDAWPAEPCVDGATWIERTLAAALVAAVDQPLSIWSYPGDELHLDAARVIRLDRAA